MAIRWTCRAAALLGVIGCGDMGAEPSLLDEPRVLALQATPRAIPTSGTVVLDALVHAGAGLTWSACAAPWQPSVPLKCATGAIPLGVGAPITVAFPADLDTVYVQLAVDGGTPAVLRLTRSDDVSANPAVTALRVEDDSPLPGTLGVSKTLLVEAVAENPDGSELVTTYFTTGGKVDPWHTLALGAATWTAPAEPGPVTLTAVVRDANGGVGWRSESVEVVP